MFTKNTIALLKPAAVLLVVTLTAAFALGFVYDTTKEPIARQKAKTETETVAALIPGTDDTSVEIVNIDDSIVTKVTTCRTGGMVTGYAITVSTTGYGGAVEIMVGINTDGIIQGVQILEHAETAGLGANADSPAFTSQFKGKTGTLKVTKVAGSSKPDEIEAITSATITSNAVTAGVNAASDYFNMYLAGVSH